MGSKKQKAYRARIRREVIANGAGTDQGSMRWHNYHGSKGDKPASHRRPFRGGRVACRLSLAQKSRRVRDLLKRQEAAEKARKPYNVYVMEGC